MIIQLVTESIKPMMLIDFKILNYLCISGIIMTLS